jgi:lysophospholipase L1-like esterase
MLECLILGDSIAVVTKMFAPTECVSYAKGGINSWQWNKKWGRVPLKAKTIVISLGANDHKGVDTDAELRKIRARIHGSSVVWIMPPCNVKFCKLSVNAIVRSVAVSYGDKMLGTSYLQPDKIHPSWRGYKELVKRAGI